MVLLASILWVVWDEVSYRRPWKEYQAEFNRLESNSVQESLKQEKLKVAAKLSQLDKAIEKTSQELDRNKDLITSKKRLAENKENLEKCDIKTEDIINGEYYSLMKVPIALLFMPLCKSYGIYEENFIN